MMPTENMKGVRYGHGQGTRTGRQMVETLTGRMTVTHMFTEHTKFIATAGKHGTTFTE